MQNYIEKIQEILNRTNWSQAQFAREVGVTFATVNRWLRRHTRPHPAQLRQIERLFKNIVGIIPLSENEISQIIEKVEREKQRFPKIKRVLQDEAILEELLLELTYNSDAIEGSTLTKKETEAVIFDKAKLKDKSLVEHLEAVNHAAILKDIFVGKLIPPINEVFTKRIHKALMQGVREDAGEYSKHQRGIRGVDLILPHPADIPEEMELFFNKVNSFKGHPVEHIAKMHAEFEMIHPFGDGNGRVGRLIMVAQLINKGFAPCLIAVGEKAKYYEYLEYAQKKSETHFVYFLAESILKGYKVINKWQNPDD